MLWDNFIENTIGYVYSLKDAANCSGVSERTFKLWIRKGLIPKPITIVSCFGGDLIGQFYLQKQIERMELEPRYVDDEYYLRQKEALEYLKISKKAFKQLVDDGILKKHYTIGGLVRYSSYDILNARTRDELRSESKGDK